MGNFEGVEEVEIEQLFDLCRRTLANLMRVDHEQYVVETAIVKMCHLRRDYLSVQEALHWLRSAENSGKRDQNNLMEKSPKASGRETIEDPYIKDTVNLFAAKVEKIQIKDKTR